METPFWPRFSKTGDTLPYASSAADSRYTVTSKGPWFHSEAEGRRAGATYVADDVAAAEVTAVVTRG
jgi:hypothetical protein